MAHVGKLEKDHYADDPDEITDQVGNPYPTDFFDIGDLNERGLLIDDQGREFDPFGGNRVPVEGKCNSPLTGWRDRYDEPRYCSQTVSTAGEQFFGGFCNVHKNRESIMKTAEEAMQTGTFAKTVDHMYANVDGWHRLVAHGTFEYLMGESVHEFAPEYETKEFDFSDAETVPEWADADDRATLKVGYPTDHADRALSLWQAAMDRVNMLTIKASVSSGERPLESKTTEHAQLTAPPSEDTPDEFKAEQHFETIEEWTEHHLNLPYDRLVRSHGDLLEYGGVGVDIDDGTQSMDVDELVLDIAADLEDTEAIEVSETVDDPNVFDDETPESERILESAESG